MNCEGQYYFPFDYMDERGRHHLLQEGVICMISGPLQHHSGASLQPSGMFTTARLAVSTEALRLRDEHPRMIEEEADKVSISH